MSHPHPDNLYTSLPLIPNTKTIRLLEVQPPSAALPAGTIEGQLRVVDLETRPPFAALSYVWGNDVGAATILCAGSPLPVSNNCHSALRHLQKKLGGFTIWIDAICLNQDDEAEKVHQIQLMADIYAAAETVYLWLGDGNEQSDRAMSYFAKCDINKYFRASGGEAAAPSLNRQAWSALWHLYSSQRRLSSYPFPTEGTCDFRSLDHVSRGRQRLPSTLQVSQARRALRVYGDDCLPGHYQRDSQLTRICLT